MSYSQFDRVPNHYAGLMIQKVKDFRQANGKRLLSPTLLKILLHFLVNRQFGVASTNNTDSKPPF